MNFVNQEQRTACKGPGSAVLADQAIFTSIRSPAGAGYQIIAASAGLRPEERAEIIRRSPSHGSLCGTGSPSVAVAAYPLPTGRYCVAWTRPAGVEHTGRGGDRVYTHMLLLGKESFERFGCNPLAVRRAAPEIAEAPPILKPPSFLPPLELGPSSRPSVLIPAQLCVDLLCEAAAAVLSGQRLVIREEPAATAALEWTLMLMPLSARRKLAISVGLKLAPSRPMQLAWVGSETGANGLSWQDPQARVLQRGEYSPDGLPSPAGWFNLIRRWWRERRWDEIQQLSGDLIMEVQPCDLDRLAKLCDALDLAPGADGEQLRSLRECCEDAQTANFVEERLLGQLHQAIDRRQARLDREHQQKIQMLQQLGDAVTGATVP